MAHTVEVNTPLEALLVEQALAMAREWGAVADAAPDGHVLAQAEQAAVRLGREFMRRAWRRRCSSRRPPPKKRGGWPSLPLRPPPLRQRRGRQDHRDLGRRGAAAASVLPLPRLRRPGLPPGRPAGVGGLPQPAGDAPGLSGSGQLVLRRCRRASGRTGRGRPGRRQVQRLDTHEGSRLRRGRGRPVTSLRTTPNRRPSCTASNLPAAPEPFLKAVHPSATAWSSAASACTAGTGWPTPAATTTSPSPWATPGP